MTVFGLRLIALICMLLDHIGRTLLPDAVWLTYIGRLSFPIFAFQLAEGYQHTRNKQKYALKLFLFALLSEIPFDLMAYNKLFYWGHQNILWTLLLGLSCICVVDYIRSSSQDLFYKSTLSFVSTALFFVLATVLRLDYIGWGILQILFFYFYSKDGNRAIPLVVAGTMFCNLIGSDLDLSLAGVPLPSQGFALLALIPIFCYQGRLGSHSKWWSRFCYAFYPLHLLVLFGVGHIC